MNLTFTLVHVPNGTRGNEGASKWQVGVGLSRM